MKFGAHHIFEDEKSTLHKKLILANAVFKLFELTFSDVFVSPIFKASLSSNQKPPTGANR